MVSNHVNNPKLGIGWQWKKTLFAKFVYCLICIRVRCDWNATSINWGLTFTCLARCRFPYLTTVLQYIVATVDLKATSTLSDFYNQTFMPFSLIWKVRGISRALSLEICSVGHILFISISPRTRTSLPSPVAKPARHLVMQMQIFQCL